MILRGCILFPGISARVTVLKVASALSADCYDRSTAGRGYTFPITETMTLFAQCYDTLARGEDIFRSLVSICRAVNQSICRDAVCVYQCVIYNCRLKDDVFYSLYYFRCTPIKCLGREIMLTVLTVPKIYSPRNTNYKFQN